MEAALEARWLDRLTAAMDDFVEGSRALTTSSREILIAPGHTAEKPMLRRIPQTVAHHTTFEEFGLRGPLLDVVEDLIGPDIRFHHSKLNFKSPGGGEEIKWHQDIQFWPHSNYAPLTIGVYLTDVDGDMAPMGVVGGSHVGPLFDLRDVAGEWTGALSEADLAQVDFGRLLWLTGSRGSVTVHNCRLVHGSRANLSPRMRPLLLHTYAPCDAFPLTDLVARSPLSNTLVRGQPAEAARTDPTPYPTPPEWGRSGGYSSIFAAQQEGMA